MFIEAFDNAEGKLTLDIVKLLLKFIYLFKQKMGDFPDDDATILRKYVTNLAGCQMCNQKYTQPRLLHCMHAFCYKCVAPLSKHFFFGYCISIH